MDIDKHWEIILTWLSRSGSVVASAMMLVTLCVTLSVSGLRSKLCFAQDWKLNWCLGPGPGMRMDARTHIGKEGSSGARLRLRLASHRPLRLYYILLNFTKENPWNDLQLLLLRLNNFRFFLRVRVLGGFDQNQKNRLDGWMVFVV